MPRDLNGIQHPEGSWACTQCNNINWPKRTECNKCRLPRAGLKPGIASLGGPQSAQPGSWVCPVCANVNWPARTVCNKGCGTTKPQVGAAQYGQQLTQLSQMAGLNLEPYLQSLLSNPYLASSGVPGEMPVDAYANPGVVPAPVGNHPPGSWACPACKNINWPKRTQCNKPGCLTLRPGLSPESVMMNPGGHPEGSWLCPMCSNVNWPARTECNKPNCRTPRPTA